MKIDFYPDFPRFPAWVVWAFRKGDKTEWAAPAELQPMLRAFAERANFRGDKGAIQVWPLENRKPAVVLLAVGLGPAAGLSGPGWEQAAAMAARQARKTGLSDLAFALAENGADPADQARRMARGARTGNYVFSRFLTDEKASGAPLSRLAFCGKAALNRSVQAAAREGDIEGKTLNEVRDLANLPGNEATPAVIADTAMSLARKYGLSGSVMTRPQLEKNGFRTLLAVARGSRNDPRLITLRHKGSPRYAKEKPLVFVGKTLTFDSGGISLKPGKGMEWMRYDKCGGMAVLAAMAAAGALKLPRPAIGILAAAENLPDGNATRPGDVVRSLAGPTIEILNTDAEGRLVLADALAWAAKQYNPKAMVDLATLTGAVVICLGHEAAGLLSPDETLSERLLALGRQSGDRLWPLPLWPEYDEALKTPFADLKNIGDGSAGTIAGGAFLKKFVPPGVPWAHLDIAGTAWTEKDLPWQGAGATLFGARLLTDWIRNP